MANHRSSVESYKKKDSKLYNLMRELGSDCFYIELLLDFPCERKEQLTAKEAEYIRQMGTLNKLINGRTKKEWEHDNHEHVKAVKKQY